MKSLNYAFEFVGELTLNINTREFLKDKISLDDFGGNCSMAYDLMLEIGCEMPDELQGEDFTDIVKNQEGEYFVYYSSGSLSSCMYIKLYPLFSNS